MKDTSKATVRGGAFSSCLRGPGDSHPLRPLTLAWAYQETGLGRKNTTLAPPVAPLAIPNP